MKVVIIVINLVNILTINCLTILKVSNDSNETASVEKDCCGNRLSETVLSLLEYFNQECLLHLVLSEGDPSCLLPADLNFLFNKFQLVITQPSTQEKVNDFLREHPHVYIMLIKDYCNFYQFLYMMNQLILNELSWNPIAIFLLIASTSLDTRQLQDELMIETFNWMWQKNVLRVAILMCQTVASRQLILLFSSIPFSKLYKTCKEINNSSQLQEIDLTSSDLTTKSIIGFQFETPKTFLGCPIIATTYPFPPYSVAENEKINEYSNITYKSGIEFNLALLLAKQYNLSLTINTPDYLNHNVWVDHLPNGTTIGMIYGILNYKTDLAFAGAIPPDSNYFKLRQVYIYVVNSMGWYVPDPDLIASWELVTNTFSGLTWLLLLSFFVFFITFYYMMRNVTLEMRRPEEPVSLIMWRLTLGIPAYSLPRFSHLRILLVTWSLFSMNITIMFNTKLFSVLTQRPEEIGITTIEDLHKSNLKTCATSVYRNYFLNKTDNLMREILERATVCDDLEEAVKSFLQRRDFGILAKDNHMAFLIKDKIDKVHKLPENFITYPVSMFVTKGSILAKPLTTMVERVTESGLMGKWLNDVSREVIDKFLSHEKESSTQKNVILQKEDLFWLNVLLLSGLTVAFAVLVIEMFSKKHKTINKIPTYLKLYTEK